MMSVLYFTACSSQELPEPTQELPKSTQDSLVGKWNVVENKWDFANALFYYEHGFELLDENKYFSRFFQNDDNSFITDTAYGGDWYVNKKKQLVFENLNTSIIFDLKIISMDKIEITEAKEKGKDYIAVKEQ